MTARKSVDGLLDVGNLLVEQQGGFLLGLLARALKMVMESEVSELCGASPGERSEERANHRNGYRERALETRLGTVQLDIPKVRRGSYFPSFLEPRRRWEQAFVSVVSEAYVSGVSTRRVEELVEAMGARGMSKSTVSRMAEDLDKQVKEFRERPLDEPCPYVWLDATYVKVREGGRVVSKAVLLAFGVTLSGERTVLGIDVADGEMEDAWRKFMNSLVQRGLRGVRLVISDAHEGLKSARRAVFNGAAWQRCTVHFQRNVLARVPKSAQGFALATLKAAFQQPTHELARQTLRKAADVLEEKYPAAARIVREAEDEVLTYMTFPEKHWRQIHSTNPLERVNREIKRRTDVVGIFPTTTSVLRLVTMLMVEQDDEWRIGRRYFSLESMASLIPSAPALPGKAAA